MDKEESQGGEAACLTAPSQRQSQGQRQLSWPRDQNTSHSSRKRAIPETNGRECLHKNVSPSASIQMTFDFFFFFWNEHIWYLFWKAFRSVIFYQRNRKIQGNIWTYWETKIIEKPLKFTLYLWYEQNFRTSKRLAGISLEHVDWAGANKTWQMANVKYTN